MFKGSPTGERAFYAVTVRVTVDTSCILLFEIAVPKQGFRRPGVRTEDVGRTPSRMDRGPDARRSPGNHRLAGRIQQGGNTVGYQHRQTAFGARLKR